MKTIYTGEFDATKEKENAKDDMISGFIIGLLATVFVFLAGLALGGKL